MNGCHTNLEPEVKKQKILTIGHVLLRQGIVSPHKILHKERHTKNSFEKKINSFGNGLCIKSELYKSQVLLQKFIGNAEVLLKGCGPLPRFETQP